MWPLEGEHPRPCGVDVVRQMAELVIDIAVECKSGEE